MSTLNTSSSPIMLDKAYRVPDETAPKDIWLGYNHVLHVAQSLKLMAQVLEDICLLYLRSGLNARL